MMKWPGMFSIGTAAVLVPLVGGVVVAQGAEGLPDRRPNLPPIISDDRDWGDLRWHGSPLVDMPVPE
jgi:hypothetical protein